MVPRPSCTAVLAAVLLSACGTPEPSTEPASSGTSSRAGTGAEETARRFVSALNRGDAAAAAELVDWEGYVSRDATLVALLETLQKQYAADPGDPALDRPLWSDASVTRREVLAAERPGALMVQEVKARFVKQVSGELQAPERVCDAELLVFGHDRRHTDATIRMPNGRIIEFKMSWRNGIYRLLPLW